MFAPVRRILRRPAGYWLMNLVILTFMVRLIWGWCVEDVLRKKLNAIRARNEPTDPSHIVHPLIPDDENAVPIYHQAVKAVAEGVDSPRTSNLEYPDFFPPSAAWMKLAEGSEKANQSAFALARQARQRPRAQFATSPAGEIDLEFLSAFRDLASKISDGAQYAHLQGNDREAIQRLLDLLHMSKTIQCDDYLISNLVGVGIDALACESTLLIAPDLPVRSVNVQRLIDELLDEQRYYDNFKRVLLNERTREIHGYSDIGRSNWLLSPLAKRDLLRDLFNFQIFLQAADATNSADTEAILSGCRWDKPQETRTLVYFPRYSRWFSYAANVEPWFDRNYRVLAERRLTAVALACQLYRADHGQFPNTLDQLVPTYLRKLPADPFFADGRPIGYTIKTLAPPLSGSRPMLYFDPGGADTGPPAEPIYGWYAQPIKGPPVRQYRDLSRFTPPLKKAVNNNPYQSNAPGYYRQQNNGSP